MEVRVLEMREPKSVTVRIQQRGWWDIIGDRRDEQELEIEVIEDVVVNGSKVLEFELRGLCCEVGICEHYSLHLADS